MPTTQDTPPNTPPDAPLGLPALARRSLTYAADLKHVLERIRAHAMRPRMEPAEFRSVVAALGYESLDTFADALHLSRRTVASWSHLGMSQDAAQLLLALLDYRTRVEQAIGDVDSYMHVGLGDFFKDYRLP